jgi:hypothetical protein
LGNAEPELLHPMSIQSNRTFKMKKGERLRIDETKSVIIPLIGIEEHPSSSQAVHPDMKHHRIFASLAGFRSPDLSKRAAEIAESL